MNGFIYSLTSSKYETPLAVSIASLRRYHDEPITVFAVEGLKVPAGVSVEPIRITKVFPGKRKLAEHQMTKLDCCLRTPYENTTFLDADTLIRSRLDIYWGGPFTIAQIHTRKRMNKPLINSGVFGFDRARLPFLEKCRDTAKRLRVNDQRAIQAKYRPEECVILDQSWNLTPGHFGLDDPKVVHFVGQCWNAQEGRWQREWRKVRDGL